MQKTNDKISETQIKSGSNFPPGCLAVQQGSGSVARAPSSAQLCVCPSPSGTTVLQVPLLFPAQWCDHGRSWGLYGGNGQLKGWNLLKKPFPLCEFPQL